MTGKRGGERLSVVVLLLDLNDAVIVVLTQITDRCLAADT